MNGVTKLCIRKNVISSLLIQQKRTLFMNPILKSEVKDEPPAKDENQKQEQEQEISLLEQVKQLNDKVKELQNSYLMSLADQENLRQRHQREIENAKEFSIQKFAKELLDPLDILSIALNSVPKEYRDNKDTPERAELANLYTGVSMTEKELKKTLKRFGVEESDPLDEIFDPNKHEAMFQAPMPDKKPGTIFVVQKKGYLLKNRVLRPAQVGIVADQ